MNHVTALAVDLGSSSGRIVAGTLIDGRIDEVEVRRFPHQARFVDGYLTWDLDFIWSEVVAGLREAVSRFPDAVSVSVDTWGVDSVCLDDDFKRVAPGRAYRDERTIRTHTAFRSRLSDEAAWAATGIAPATINTANQLFAYLHEEPGAAADTDHVLLLPDYFTYLLSGQVGWSRSHASSSGLCAPGANEFNDEVFEALGIPRDWFGDVSPEHSVVGPCTVEGLEHLTVVRAGAHDTACAVHALQRDVTQESYFLSCGSWSVLGVLRDEPLLSDAARDLGLTNEACAGPGVRPLFNITGMWILQECQREWEAAGQPHQISELIQLAQDADSLGNTFDPDDGGFASVGGMVQRVRAAVAPNQDASQGQIVLAILESLAARYARGLADIAALTGTPARQLNIMGGGSKNDLLCQLTATAAGVPVTVGPAEATTLGALIAQFEVRGELPAQDRDTVIQQCANTRRFEP